MNKFVKIVALILCLSLTIFAGCGKEKEGNVIQNYSVNVNETTIIELGDTFQIVAGHGQKAITYASDNIEIASVSSKGLVKANAVGTCYITISANGVDDVYVCEFKVVKYDYTIKFTTDNDFKLIVGGTKKLSIMAYRDGVEYEDDVVWEVDLTTGQLFVDGYSADFIASSVGVYTVTVTSSKGATAQIQIDVVQI